jgi:hypothetical protein
MGFINNSLFKLSEIPNYNPLIEVHDRKLFWKGEKRKCIEGTWQSGKWMPGPLYYYINFHNIQVEAKGSKSLSLGLPWLRDIDWELFYLYEECRGFSGFTGDTVNTCDRKYGPEKATSILLERITKEEAESKTYIPARDYLRKIHGKSLGKPLYENEAKHFISVQARGSGKSYSSSAFIAHNFLFDGATDYDMYLDRKSGKVIGEKSFASDTIIGGIDAKYTNDLAKKSRVAMTNLPGATKYLEVEYSSPLLTSFTGSLMPSKVLTNSNNSVMRNITFRDNPLAANGTRPNLAVIDEVGFMNNLQETWGALEATQASKSKTLVIWGLGTGGLVSGKAALYAEQVFRNPSDYNCIEFEDVFENRGKIGYFLPYTKALIEFKKGPNYITDLPLASKFVEMRRDTAKAASNPSVYQTEVINGPIKPSEAFLVLDSGEFPTFILKERLAKVEGNKEKYLDSTLKGDLVFDNQGQVEFKSIQGKRVIRNFPLQKNDDRVGGVELFAHPEQFKINGSIPRGLFIAGADVVDKDKSTTSSLPSIFVMNRLTREVVAEYTGRTDNAKDFYEICRKLTLFYNASLMYEKNLVGLFNHFDQYKCAYLLADTPHQLRSSDTYKTSGNTSKGINATGKINKIARDYTNSWLLEKLGINHSVTVAETLRSPALIRELIMWNIDGNFDRVSAIGMMLWHDATLYTKTPDAKKKEITGFLNSEYFRKQGLLI